MNTSIKSHGASNILQEPSRGFQCAARLDNALPHPQLTLQKLLVIQLDLGQPSDWRFSRAKHGTKARLKKHLELKMDMKTRCFPTLTLTFWANNQPAPPQLAHIKFFASNEEDKDLGHPPSFDPTPLAQEPGQDCHLHVPFISQVRKLETGTSSSCQILSISSDIT